MKTILDCFAHIGIIGDKVKILYQPVVHQYSSKRFRGLVEYQLKTVYQSLKKILIECT